MAVFPPAADGRPEQPDVPPSAERRQSGRCRGAGQHGLHPVRPVQLQCLPDALEHGVLPVSGAPAAAAAVLRLYAVHEPRDRALGRAAHGHPDHRSGLYHPDQPLHRDPVLFRRHRLPPRPVVSAAVRQRPAAHRGGSGLCRGAPRVGQPPQSRVALRGLCARRPRHRRAGRQPLGADDRLRSLAQHPRHVSDHQQPLRVHGQPDRPERQAVPAAPDGRADRRAQGLSHHHGLRLPARPHEQDRGHAGRRRIPSPRGGADAGDRGQERVPRHGQALSAADVLAARVRDLPDAAARAVPYAAGRRAVRPPRRSSCAAW